MEVTLGNFRNLPWLLSRAEFMEVTGLGERELAALVESGGIVPWRPMMGEPPKGGTTCGGKREKGKRVGPYAKYRKVDAARIAGIEKWLE